MKTDIKGTLREDRHTFMSISRLILYKMKNVLGKFYTVNQNTHFVFSSFLFRK
jgi:hypothetical protein